IFFFSSRTRHTSFSRDWSSDACSSDLFLLSTLSLLLGSGLIGQAVAGDQLQKIKDSGTINVGLEGTYPPFSFVDESVKLVGFERSEERRVGYRRRQRRSCEHQMIQSAL